MRIKTYTIFTTPTGQEFVIGTDPNDGNKTKNFLLQDIADLATGGGGGGNAGVENTYVNIAAMLADQGNQTDNAIQCVTDASGEASVDTGYAYYEYLGTTGAVITDYRKLSEEESMDVADDDGLEGDLIVVGSTINGTGVVNDDISKAVNRSFRTNIIIGNNEAFYFEAFNVVGTGTLSDGISLVREVYRWIGGDRTIAADSVLTEFVRISRETIKSSLVIQGVGNPIIYDVGWNDITDPDGGVNASSDTYVIDSAANDTYFAIYDNTSLTSKDYALWRFIGANGTYGFGGSSTVIGDFELIYDSTVNGGTIPPLVQSDWNESDTNSPAYIKNKPAIGAGIENSYADIAALTADQGNQTNTALQHVADASADPNVTSGYAYYEYLGTTTPSIADYRLVSQENAGSGSSGNKQTEQTASFELNATDDDSLIYCNGANIVITVSNLLPDNFECTIYNKNSTPVTFVSSGSNPVTLIYPDGTNLEQDKICWLGRELATNNFRAKGELI